MTQPERDPLHQRLDELENPLLPLEQPTGVNRWLLPYADMMTLLLGLFLVLFVGTQHWNRQLAEENAAWQEERAGVEETIALQEEQLVLSNQQVVQLRASLAEMTRQLTDWQTRQPMDGVAVQQDARGLRISLAEDITFAPGEATLTPTAKQTLAVVAKELRRLDSPLRVEGHTDDTPIQTADFPSNWELSTARALAILHHLVQQEGLDPAKVSAAGYAHYQPLAENSTVEGKQKNRRVDIVVLGQPTAVGQTSGLPPQHPATRTGEAATPANRTTSVDQKTVTQQTEGGMHQRVDGTLQSPGMAAPPRAISRKSSTAAAASTTPETLPPTAVVVPPASPLR